MKPDLLNTLPFPVAQLYLRTRNAKSWAEKHHNAYYLLEATAKWLASMATIQYLREEGSRTKKADEALKALALPSTGQWVQILRTLAEHFSKRVDAASHPLGPWSQSLLGRRDLPKSSAFIKKLTELDGMDPGVGSSLSPMDLFNVLPAYRNKHLGHGALAKEGFYAEMAPVLLEAATELLGELDLLVKGDCLFVEEKRETGDGSVIVERIRFVGQSPMRMEPLVLKPGEAYQCQPGKLYLDWGSGVEPLQLFPLLHATWQEEQAEVFFLNRSLRGDTPEYLSYASGRILKGEGFEGEFRSFLGRVVKREIDSKEEKRLREQSLSDSGAEAEPLPDGVQRLGHFRLYGELGKGGMGVVYLAEQESLHRFVALKTLPFEKGRDPVRQARFLREIQSLSKTESSNVVKILDSGEEQGVLWYAMELVDGVELSGVIEELRKAKEEKKKLKGSDLWVAINKALQNERNRRRLLLGQEALPETEPPPVPEHLRPYQNKNVGLSLAVLMQDAAKALQNIHEQERPVIHRDIKPTNLMVTAEGHLVLMDFGLARMEGGTTLTVADTVLGTIRYAPPEQIRRMAKVDTRADIYSLGATFHELATLGPLYQADSEVELISKITDETSKPENIHALDKDIPEDLCIILQKCVLKDPAQRYGSARELAEDLQRFLSGSPILARKPSYRYYMKMFARKYRAALAVATVSSTLLLALLVGSAIWNMQERRKAEQEAKTSKQVSDFLVSIFKVSDPNEAKGNKIMAREILDKGAQKIETELKDQPLVQARLMDTMGNVYVGLGLYKGAEPLLEKALKTRESRLPPGHPEVAVSLTSLAVLYKTQGKYAEAEPLYKRSLAILEMTLGPDDPAVATALGNLAALYGAQGKYGEAEPLLTRALAIDEKSLGPNHPEVAWDLSYLVVLYYAQGRYAEAEPLSKRSLAIREKALGLDHPEVAEALNNLAQLYKAQGKYAAAEPLCNRALAIREKALGPNHPIVSESLNSLAALYYREGKYAEAEPLFKRSLAICEKALGPDHPDVATQLNNLATLYEKQGMYAEAEPLFKRSLAIFERALGPDHPDVAQSLSNLAGLYYAQGKYEDAEPLFKRALATQEKVLGPDHPSVAKTLINYAKLLRATNRVSEAEKLEARAKAIQDKQKGAQEKK